MKTIIVKAPRARRSASGFTLTEILLATLITAIVMATIYGVIAATMRARERVHEQSLRNNIGPTVLALIEEDLQGLFGYNIWGDRILRGIDHTENGQDADGLDFLTTTNSFAPGNVGGPESDVHSDLSEVGYHLKPNPLDSNFLELWRRESFHVDDEPFAGGSYTKLYDRVRSLNIQYFQELGEEAEPFDEWNSFEMQALPRALRIELVIEVLPRADDQQFISAEEEELRTLIFQTVISIPEGLMQASELQPVIPNLVVKKDDDDKDGDENDDGGDGGKKNDGDDDPFKDGGGGPGPRDGGPGPSLKGGNVRGGGGRAGVLR